MNQLVKLPRGLTLRPGQEYWEDNPHLLAVRLRRETAKGRIAEMVRLPVSPGRVGAIVVRLKPRPTWRRTAALWASGGAVAGSAVAAGIYWVAVHLEQILIALGAIAAAAVLLASLTRVLLGHRPMCTGLHCPGCQH